MSEQYPGGFITKTAPTVSTSSAQGMWTLSQQAGYQKQGLWPVPYVPDAQFNYVTMLLHGDGTNGAQNNTFLDSSTNNFTITRGGNTTQGSFSPYGSNWSNYFGTSNYLTVGYNSAISLGSGDFTFDMWIFPTTSSRATLYLESGDRQGIFIDYNNGNNGISVFATATNGSWSIINGDPGNPGYGSSNTITLNRWNHFAFVRNGTNWSTYINGVRDLNITASGTIYEGGGSRYISFFPANGLYLLGYMSNFRLVKGTALYSGSTITVPTAPLTAVSGTGLLTCQANRFVDSSGNSLTVTPSGTPSVQRFNPFGTSTAYSTSVIGGSGYFDGTGDYLDGPTNSAFAFGTGDFTISAWVYVLNGTSAQNIWTNQTTSSANAPNLVFFILNNNVCIANTNTAHVASSGTIANNSWNYIGVTRASGTYTFYINGSTSGTTGTIGTDNITENACHIGYGNYGTSYYFGGYIADLRIIKGSAVAPTVPTAPIGTVTNTQLLLNYINGAIFDNAMMNDLETVGNAQISTSVKKYGTGSLAFDGTGDYLLGPSTPNMSFGSGDFTTEAWVYRTASPGNNQTIFQKGRTTDSNLEFSMILSGSNFLSCFYTTDGSTVAQPFSSTTAVALNTWTHIALTRSGSTWRCFVNGTLEATTTAAVTLYTGNGVISSGANPIGDNPLTGYIDELRITKGYCRYTATFTPPTAAFPNTGPTV